MCLIVLILSDCMVYPDLILKMSNYTSNTTKKVKKRPLTASITCEVKNDHAHVTTQRILSKFIEINFSVGMYGLAVMLSIPRLTTSKNIDEIR